MKGLFLPVLDFNTVLVLLYRILEKRALSIFRVAKSEFTLKTETTSSP
jgi:hypothetical protein